jgi:hypothetical protein
MFMGILRGGKFKAKVQLPQINESLENNELQLIGIT